MVDQTELSTYVRTSFPQLSGICTGNAAFNAQEFVHKLAGHTKLQLRRRDMAGASQCLQLADSLYSAGNATIKNAIENVYVYGFSYAFFCDDRTRNELIQLIPASLYAVYKRQVINSHL